MKEKIIQQIIRFSLCIERLQESLSVKLTEIPNKIGIAKDKSNIDDKQNGFQ